MNEPRSVRVAIALTWGICAAIAFYAVLRLRQVMTTREPDPAQILFSAHAAFFWRSWIAGYAGGMVALLASFAEPRASARVLRFALPAAAAVFALVATFTP